MSATVADIIKAMETIAPSNLAEDWDNVGLQVGQKKWPVKKVWISLDPGLDVVANACQNDVDLLITHHPLIFKPLRSVDFSTPTGSIIRMSAKRKMAIFSSHTNLDIVTEGLNDVLAEAIGLKKLEVLGKPAKDDLYSLLANKNRNGMGRIGELDEKIELKSLALKIKEKLRLKHVKISGNHKLAVKKAAVCTGSGSGMMKYFLSSGAEVYISGDLKYHDARDAQAVNLGIIDIGHFASEHLIVDVLAKRLERVLSEAGIYVEVKPYSLEDDPFDIV